MKLGPDGGVRFTPPNLTCMLGAQCAYYRLFPIAVFALVFALNLILASSLSLLKLHCQFVYLPHRNHSLWDLFSATE